MHKTLTNMQLYLKNAGKYAFMFYYQYINFKIQKHFFNKFLFIESHYTKSFKNKLII